MVCPPAGWDWCESIYGASEQKRPEFGAVLKDSITLEAIKRYTTVNEMTQREGGRQCRSAHGRRSFDACILPLKKLNK